MARSYQGLTDEAAIGLGHGLSGWASFRASSLRIATIAIESEHSTRSVDIVHPNRKNRYPASLGFEPRLRLATGKKPLSPREKISANAIDGIVCSLMVLSWQL